MARITTRSLLLAAAVLLGASSAEAATPAGRGHGPPDTLPKAPRVCVAGPVRCDTTIYATVGQSCGCVSKAGKQLRGEVRWKDW